MAAITVRNLPDATHRALKARARSNERSTEAEVRAILEAAVAPRARIGSLLLDIGRDVDGIELDLDRDRTPDEPVELG